MKNFLAILFIVVIFFVSPTVIHAKLWINEFSSNGSSDWIEVYNQSDDAVSLDGLIFRDSSATNKLQLSGEIGPNEFAVFEWGDKLNNSGDTIKLVQSDESSIHDQVTYGNSSDISAPVAGQTAGRQSDGSANWILFVSASRNASNAQSTAAPTATPIPEKTPTPIKQPTPTKTPTPKKEPTPTKLPTTAATGNGELEDSKTTDRLQQATSTKRFKISGIPTSILGMATNSATPTSKAKISPKPNGKVMVKNATSAPLLIMIAGTIFCLACAILVFLKRRKQQEA